MARLTHPENGTVIHVDDEAAGKYQAAGWLGDDETDETDETEPATDDDSDDVDDTPEPVAPHGNASTEKWSEYARALDVTVEDDADRNAIKAAIAAAGK